MASSLGSLVVRLGLDAADYTSALTKAEASAARFASSTQRSMEGISRSNEQLTRSVGYLKNAFAGITAALGVSELVKLSDEYQNVNARLRIFAASNNDLVKIQEQVFAVAQNTRQSLGATADLYYQLANATQEAGLSQKEIVNIVEGVNKALIISGSSGSSAKGAIIQLSQALAAGKLRGQEFNTVNEQGNRIIRALGEGLGKTTAQLRQMANDGEITTDVFVYGFTRGLGTIGKEFEKIPITVGGAFQQATNELQKFIGTVLQNANESNKLSAAISFVGKNIDILSAAAIGFVGVKLLTIVGNLAAKFLETSVALGVNAVATRKVTAETVKAAEAELAYTIALKASAAAAVQKNMYALAAAEGAVVQTAATAAAANSASMAIAAARAAEAVATAKVVAQNTALASAQAAVATKTGLAARALGLLGGPIGTVITVLGLAATAWEIYELRSTKANENAAKATEDATEDIISSLEKQYIKLKQLNDAASTTGPSQEKNAAAKMELDRLQKEIEVERTLVSDLGAKTSDRLEQLSHRYAVIAGNLDRIQKEDLAKGVRERGEAASKMLQDLATDAEKMQAELKKLDDTVGRDNPNYELIAKRIREKFTKKEPKVVDDPARKIFEGQVKVLEASIAREKDILVAHESFLRDTYSEGLLSVNDYYGKLQDARSENLRNTLQTYDTEIAAAENLLAHVKKDQDKQDVLNRIDDIRAKQVNAIRDAGFAEQALNRERSRAAQEYSDQLSELNAKMLELQGNTAAAATIRFATSNRVLNNQLNANGDAGAIALNRALAEQVTIQAALNDKSQQYGIILGTLDVAQERLNMMRSVGGISEVENLTKMSELNAQYAVQLRKVVEEYAAIAAASKDPAALLKVEQLRVAIEKLELQTDLLGDKFNQIFATEFSQALQDVVNGTKSVKDAFLDMAKSITKAINQIAANSLADALFGKGKPASGAGSFFSSLFGGSFDFSKILSLFTGGSGSGLGYGTIGSNIPSGPFPYAAGTSFHPGGLALVGEQGPELLNLPRGSKVMPAGETRRVLGQPNMTFNVNVLPGADKRSARQAGESLRDVVVRSLKDR